jgi:hypothetical protein
MARRERAMSRVLRPGEVDAGAFDREFWQRAGTEAIFLAAAAMVPARAGRKPCDARGHAAPLRPGQNCHRTDTLRSIGSRVIDFVPPTLV